MFMLTSGNTWSPFCVELLFVPLVHYVFDVFPCLKEILVETECPQKTTTVIPKLGVIKLLYTLNFDLLRTFMHIFIYCGRQQK